MLPQLQRLSDAKDSRARRKDDEENVRPLSGQGRAPTDLCSYRTNGCSIHPASKWWWEIFRSISPFIRMENLPPCSMVATVKTRGACWTLQKPRLSREPKSKRPSTVLSSRPMGKLWHA